MGRVLHRDGVGHLYEYLPILASIVGEGKWRSSRVTHHKAWLRENFAEQVRRATRGALDDYDKTGKRARGGPKFDRRNGALIEACVRPFAEFAVRCADGNTVSLEEVIGRRFAAIDPEDGNGSIPWPADADDLKFLGGRTLAERWESDNCKFMVTMLRFERPTFDKALTKAISGLKWLAKRFRLDCDETEVLAVMSLLWDAGPRIYLNQVDEANKKRLRNGWDRLDRKLKDPQFRARFHRKSVWHS
jgi:hypothetical protein